MTITSINLSFFCFFFFFVNNFNFVDKYKYKKNGVNYWRP